MTPCEREGQRFDGYCVQKHFAYVQTGQGDDLSVADGRDCHKGHQRVLIRLELVEKPQTGVGDGCGVGGGERLFGGVVEESHCDE